MISVLLKKMSNIWEILENKFSQQEPSAINVSTPASRNLENDFRSNIKGEKFWIFTKLNKSYNFYIQIQGNYFSLINHEILKTIY